MKRPNIYIKSIIETIVIFAVAMAVSVLLTSLCSCARKIYVPVENTVMRTDTVYSAKLRVDSVIFRDSVAVIQKVTMFASD